MPDLPTGTVTFLFTDIEGSTTRWEQQTEAMQTALARHDDILRSAIEQHDGIVFKTVGDAFYTVFARAPNALRAALAAQHALHAEAWDAAIGAVPVRMALHTGTPEARGGDYFGPPLNRVARLVSAGRGGQVLLSAATQELTRDLLPPGVELRDLGEHRLKDLTRPERIFQVNTSDLPADFPALRTLDNRPNNLPVQRDALIGRERDVAAISALLRRQGGGLVTLTGPGGTGKTRLSLQVAADLLDEFADGVWFVELAPISDPALIPSTIAQVLGVKETGEQVLVDTLKVYLREKQLLLVLDNFEQVVAAASLIADLLKSVARLKVLVTTREVLRLVGEQEYPVPTLDLPDLKQRESLERLTQYAAVALFIQRAQASRPGFQITNENAPAVAEICVRLDGLPLAIELAAARVKLLPPVALLARLDHRLGILTGGPRDRTARQQTLRGAIDWSYHLLPPNEQILFARLGVFVGGSTLDTIEAISIAVGEPSGDIFDELASLVDKSLVRQDLGTEDEPRFVMLETIREYAQERLEASGTAAMVRAAHAGWVLQMAETAARELQGAGQVEWLSRLAQEQENVRAALSWTLGTNGSPADHQLGQRLAGALWRSWYLRGSLTEGRRWLDLALVLNHDAPAAPHATVLLGAAGLALFQTEYDVAAQHYEASLTLWRMLEDRAGQAQALNGLGLVAQRQGHYANARALYEQSAEFWRQLGEQAGLARTLANLGEVLAIEGNHTDARAAYQEALGVFRLLGERRGMANTLNGLGSAWFDQGELVQARLALEEAQALFRVMDNVQGRAWVENNLAFVDLEQDQVVGAGALFQANLEMAAELGDRWLMAECLEGVAAVLGRLHAPLRAARLWGGAAALREAIHAPAEPTMVALYARYQAAARMTVAQATWLAAWAEGEQLALDALVATACEPLPPMALEPPPVQHDGMSYLMPCED